MAEENENKSIADIREEKRPASRKGKKHRVRRKKVGVSDATGRRGRSPATPFPPVAFSTVLPLGEAIQQHGAGQPIRRLTLFEKLDRSPESSVSRLLIINSGRYGVTKGGYTAEFLELTELGAVATSPETHPREKLAARFKLAIEGIAPFKYLFDKNKGNRLPSPEVLRDSLEEVHIPPGQRTQCVDLFLENLKDLGLLRTVAGAERIIPIEQALDEIPAPGAAPASADVSVQVGAQKVVDKTKKPWKNICFVIAPIGDDESEQRKHSDMVLEALIRRAMEKDWEVVRADQIAAPGMISAQVIEHLLRSGLVIADLSFHNPNVYYELAIRHVIGRPTVHLIRKGDAIPFDLKDFRTITIDTDDKYDLVAKLETYRAEIANHVRQAATEGAESNNPIRTFAKNLKASFE
jgi:hypothetical protein